MSDYLKSALGYLNGNNASHDYVGQIIEINNVKLKVTRLLAEGGWALVYLVEDTATGKEYALKKLIAVDEEANRNIIQEIEILKNLSGHANIIRYLCTQRLEREDRKSYEYLLVTEFCPGGTVADILRGVNSVNSLTLPQICKIAYQATRAVHHMHSRPEPLVHRDIKLENFLIGSDGLVKLCDFGSTTTQQILPDTSWNAQKRSTLEDQLAKYTTPMYRPPEMMDTWNNEPIGPPVDCWALGCILYSLVTLRHPFPEGNKLAIVNAKFPPIPPNPRLGCLHDLVKGCLTTSPMERLTTSALLERLAAIAESNNFDPREPANIEVKAAAAPAKPAAPPRPTPPPVAHQSPSNSGTGTAATSAPARPTAPPSVNSAHHRAAPGRPSVGPQIHNQMQNSSSMAKVPAAMGQQSSGLFSSLKGGAGSILRNLKDTSSKVMHTVQQSMARTELDASYLTSRVLIMPYPADGIESAYRANHVEDVRAFLQTRHPPPARMQLYNLSRGRPNVTRLPGRHIDCSFAYATNDSTAPLLSAMYQIVQDMYRYLDADFNHIIVIYCTDGCRASATIACSLLLYSGALKSTDETLALFLTRRCQPAQLQPSELRSINYMSSIANGILPHTKPLVLRSLILQPVPLFTKARDGCRPYIEIYSNGALVFTTKKVDYDDMRLYGIMEGKICVVLNDATVRGDITIVAFHARQQLGRIIGIKIASLHFHTGYVPVNQSELVFDKPDLDDTPEVGGKFRIVLNVMTGEENSKIPRVPAPWETDAVSKLVPDPLFGSTLEMEETLENFRSADTHFQDDQPQRHGREKEEEGGRESAGRTGLPAKNIEGTRKVDDAKEDERVTLMESESEETNTSQEADLLNLGMQDITGGTTKTIKTPTTTTTSSPTGSSNNVPLASTAPDLDIFSTTSSQPGNDNDLLGNFASFGEPKPSNAVPPGNDLLFGNNETKGSASSNNLFFASQEKDGNRNANADLLFDPLSSSSSVGGNNDLFGWSGGQQQRPNQATTLDAPSVEENFPRNASVPNFGAQMKSDPFSNLTSSLGAGLTSSWNGTPRDSNTPRSTSPAPGGGTPMHSSPSMHKTNVNPNNESGGEAKKASGGDAFEDLLGSQGYNFFSSRKSDKDSPKTINQMRKVEAAKNMDPDRLKISEWTEGKKGNLRALLCSLHTVLWPEADRWQRYEMHQLVSAAEVKKAYRKACLAVHPDKQSGTANENMAKLIFMELNNAWSTFESDASQQHLFS